MEKNAYKIQQIELISKIKRQIKDGNFKASIYSSLADFDDDPAVCLTSICKPSAEAIDTIREEVVLPLKAIQPEHYYYEPEQFHLTVKNIRVVSYPPNFDENLIRICTEIFQKVVPSVPSFKFDLKGVINFPASCAVVGYADEEHRELVRKIDKELSKIGLEDDKKYTSKSIFFGNISVCRYRANPSPRFVAKIEELASVDLGELIVRKVELVSCNAVFKRRNKLASFYLGQRN